MLSEYFKEFFFVERNHRYYYTPDKTVELTSSTAIKKQFIPEFKKEYNLAWCVMKEKMPRYDLRHEWHEDVHEDHIRIKGKPYHYTKILETYPQDVSRIRREWKAEADFGKACGSAVHLYLEMLAQRKVIQVSSKYRPWISQALDYWKKGKPKGICETEVIMGDVKRKQAGQADRVDHVGDNLVDLYDYKTDKNPLVPEKSFGYLLPPFEDLEATLLNEYSIQVNIYARLIEENSPYKVRNLRIINIQQDDWQCYQVPRLIDRLP